MTMGVEVTARFQMLRVRAVLMRDDRDEPILVENGIAVVRGVQTETATRSKMQFNLSVLPSISQQLTIVYQAHDSGGSGTAVSNELRWNPGRKLLATFGITVFATPPGAPIYFYEPDVGLQYAWSRLDGRGSRSVAMLQVTLIRAVDLRIKFGQTIFDGQRDFGSGLDHVRTDRLRTATCSIRVQV